MRAYLRRIALLSLVSRFAFIGLLARVIDTTLASEPVLQKIAQWNVVSRRVVWVDLSTRSDTIVFVTESVTTGRLTLHWASAPRYEPLRSVDLEANVVDHTMSPDGRLVRWDYSRWYLPTEQHGFWQLPEESFPSFMDRRTAIGAVSSGVSVVTSANDVVTLRTLSFSNGDREGSVRNVISCGETSKREPVGRLARIKKWKRRRCLLLNGRTRCRHP